MSKLDIIIFFSSLSFLFYGFSCLFSDRMRNEFIRFGLAKRRLLTGVLQIIGASGLIIGYLFDPLLVVISSASLSLLMLLGFGVRLKIKDPIIASLPALIYVFLNGYICYFYLKLI